MEVLEPFFNRLSIIRQFNKYDHFSRFSQFIEYFYMKGTIVDRSYVCAYERTPKLFTPERRLLSPTVDTPVKKKLSHLQPPSSTRPFAAT